MGEKLLAAACAKTYLEKKELLAILRNNGAETFMGGYYLPEEMRDEWFSLSLEARLVGFLCAYEMYDRESDYDSRDEP